MNRHPWIYIFIGVFALGWVEANGDEKNPYACPGNRTYSVALTFDDGPSPSLTPKVLDVLKEQKVQATFFVLGKNFGSPYLSERNIPILKRMKSEGHFIGSHTYDHIHHTEVSENDARANIMRSVPVLNNYLSPILRLPYGDGARTPHDAIQKRKNDRVMKAVKDADYTHVGWDIDSRDWESDPGVVLKNFMQGICKAEGGILIFHDVKPRTAENLKKWIEEIRRAGHSLVGLEQFVPVAKEKYIPPKSEACDHCMISNTGIEPAKKAATTQIDEVDEIGSIIEELEAKKRAKKKTKKGRSK